MDGCVKYCLLLLICPACCLSDNNSNGSCYCVIPDSSSVERPDICEECSSHNLSFLASSGGFENNFTTFYILPGTHSLRQQVNVYSTNNLQSLVSVRLIGVSPEGYINLCSNNSISRALPTIQCRERESGFHFKRVFGLTISGIRIDSCGFLTNISSSSQFHPAAAVLLESVWNLTLCRVEIVESNGWGLFGAPINAISLISQAVFDRGHGSREYEGGNVLLDYEFNTSSGTHLTIEKTNITYGRSNVSDSDPTSGYGGGLRIFIRTSNEIEILLDGVLFTHNKAGRGGHMAVLYETINGAWPSTVTILNCKFNDGFGYLGGAVHVTLGVKIKNNIHNYTTASNFTAIIVKDSTFFNNSATLSSGGAYFLVHENEALMTVAHIVIENCTFDNNTNFAAYHNRSGVAIDILTFRLPGFLSHHSPQYNVSIVHCNFTRNRALTILEDSVGSGVLYTEESALLTLKDCVFENNNATGITAVHSNLVMEGNITLRNNSGFNGGGIVMCDNSIIFLNLSTEVNILIENCHAENFGGGIYAEFECSQAIPPCFFQVSDPSNIKRPHYILSNNTASRAGTALYGGAVDFCYTFIGPYNSNNRSEVFNALFYIEPSKENYLSNVSSNPLKVCFCQHGIPTCHQQLEYYHKPLYLGEDFSVSVVIVGQRDGPAPGFVEATSPNTTLSRTCPMNDLIDSECTNMSYKILSRSDFERNITVNFSFANSAFQNATIVDTRMNCALNIRIWPCPLGFSVVGNRCDCTSWVKNLKGATCDITSSSINRNGSSQWWLRLDDVTRTALYSEYCPLDYCIKTGVSLTMDGNYSENALCAYNRAGILCGGCKGILSKVLGSNHCVDCRYHFSSLRVCGLILLFAILGIVLVFLIGILDLTVSEGTLNAIVFYTNVVKVNESVLFDKPLVLLKVFVFWMNLDFGFETCFYNGMENIGKTALQFVFPLYLFILSGLIIFFSRRSSLITKLFGKNVVKILATVIFTSYAKILRTVIDVMNRAMVQVQNGNQTQEQPKIMRVWAIDGNIPYIQKIHTYLFATAVIVVAITLPYTLALLFIQCLRRRSNMKVLFWVNKLKPFFDAYTGPYNDRYHFWTGFLLVVRLSIFITLAVITISGVAFNATLIIGTMSVLFVLIQPGIYKSNTLNIIEAFAYANLTVLACRSLYDYAVQHNQSSIIQNICVGSIFILFCGIVIYHILKKLMVTRRWGVVKVWLLDRRWPWMKRKQIRSLILRNNMDSDDDTSSSDGELDPILQNAPPVARYDQLREPLVETR